MFLGEFLPVVLNRFNAMFQGCDFKTFPNGLRLAEQLMTNYFWVNNCSSGVEAILRQLAAVLYGGDRIIVWHCATLISFSLLPLYL